MKYTVTIVETLEKSVVVDAESESEALAIVNKMRDNEEIVLTADNYVDYGLKIENVKQK